MFDPTAFTTALDSKLHSKYIEQLVFMILKHIFSDKFSDFVLSDKPDIQSTDKSVGIEITEAIAPRIAQIDGEYAKLRFGKNSEYEKNKCKQLIEKNGGKVDELELSYPVTNSKEELDIFVNALRKKIKLLPSYRENGFKNMGLFIFFDEPPIPFKQEVLMKRFAEIKTDNMDQYDFLFFGYHYGVIYYDFSDMNYKNYRINEDEFDTMSQSAREFVEKDKLKTKLNL